jgi:hypothetical protein
VSIFVTTALLQPHPPAVTRHLNAGGSVSSAPTGPAIKFVDFSLELALGTIVAISSFRCTPASLSVDLW